MDCSIDECENMDLRFIGEKVKRIRFSLTKGSEQASTSTDVIERKGRRNRRRPCNKELTKCLMHDFEQKKSTTPLSIPKTLIWPKP